MACHKCKFHQKWLKMAISGYFAEMLPKAEIWPKKSIFWSKMTKKCFKVQFMQKETRVMILLRKDSLHNAWDMRNQNLLEKNQKIAN